MRQDNIAITVDMGVDVQDWGTNAKPLHVNWVHLLPYTATGTFTSRVFDATQQANWTGIVWASTTPPGTSVTMQTRSGDTPVPGETWTAFAPIDNGAATSHTSRYIQYRAVLATSDTTQTPVIGDVAISYTFGADVTRPVITGQTPVPGATSVGLSADVHVAFSEPIERTRRH